MPGTVTPDQIRSAVQARRQDILNLHLRLVGTESITLNEGPVQAVARAAMEAIGLEIDQWESSAAEIAPYIIHVGEQATFVNRPAVVGMRKGAGGGRSLMLQGHIDTVPAGDPKAWIHNTWGEIDGDEVYGLGALDMLPRQWLSLSIRIGNGKVRHRSPP